MKSISRSISLLLSATGLLLSAAAAQVELDATKIDPNMRLVPADVNGLKFHTPFEKPFELTGFPWFAQDGRYRRMPLENTPALPPGVENLAWHTAGGMVRFRSDTGRIVLKVKLKQNGRMYHMSEIGSSGFDLYVGEPGSKRFLLATRFSSGSTEYTADLLRPQARKWREFTIHFPLYSAVESVFIGLDEDAKIAPPTPWTDPRPIVAYGTSILQGGCASRPGTCYTNILSRRLNRPFFNLGFSGSGNGEKEVAEVIAQIPDPALFLLDYEANCESIDGMKKTLPPFLDALRARHPDTPILVVSGTRYSSEGLDDGGQRPEYLFTIRDIQKNEVERRKNAGDANIYFLDGSTFFGKEWHEATVDGCHPTDYGFFLMAEHLEPAIRAILEKK